MDIQKEMAQYENILSSLGYGHRSLSKSDLGYLNPITQFGFEIWYESQKAARAQAVPEGFVLVPKKPDVDKAWDIALKRIVPPPKTKDAIQQELMCKKYVDDLCSEQDRILLDYEAMIEAQEPANDSE